MHNSVQFVNMIPAKYLLISLLLSAALGIVFASDQSQGCLQCWYDACDPTGTPNPPSFFMDCCRCILNDAAGDCTQEYMDKYGNNNPDCCNNARDAFLHPYDLTSDSPENTSCSIEQIIFSNLSGQAANETPLGSDREYIVPSFSFSCSGCIHQLETLVHSVVDGGSWRETVNIQLWTMYDRIRDDGGVPLYERRANFTVTVSPEVIGAVGALHRIALPFDEEVCFEDGDVFGFGLPPASSIQIATVPTEEDDQRAYCVAAPEYVCDGISSLFEPTTGNRLDGLPLITVRLNSTIAVTTPVPQPTSSTSLTTTQIQIMQTNTPTVPTDTPTVPTDTPTAPTDTSTTDQVNGTNSTPSPESFPVVFIILAAVIGSVVCILLIVILIVLVVFVGHYLRQKEVVDGDIALDYIPSEGRLTRGSFNSVSMIRSPRMEGLMQSRWQQVAIGNTPPTGENGDPFYDVPRESNIHSQPTQLAPSQHHYHILEGPTQGYNTPQLSRNNMYQEEVKYTTMLPVRNDGMGTSGGLPAFLYTNSGEEPSYDEPVELDSHTLKPSPEVTTHQYHVLESTPGHQQEEVEGANAYDTPFELMKRPVMPSQDQLEQANSVKPSPARYAQPPHRVFAEHPLRRESKQPVYHVLEQDKAQEEEVEEGIDDSRKQTIESSQEKPPPVDHHYHILEPDSGDEDNPGRPHVFACGIYVPNTEERKKLTQGRREGVTTDIYDTWSQIKHQESRKQGFFEETETYWEPSSKVFKLYDQLARKKFREILRDQIHISQHLGAGQFGSVALASWISPDGYSKQVAVKMMRPSAMESARVKFLQEAAIMGQFNHPNVVRLYGVVTVGDPAMIVLEFMPLGDLAAYMKKNYEPGVKRPPQPQTLLSFSRQVARGMRYLAKKGYVHRDLAARNILLNETLVCKISDFGLSRGLDESSYYISKGGSVPIKWTAPEALLYKKYSSASDVYSYGMLLYEIWSLGLRPLAEVYFTKVAYKTSKGYCQHPPPGCPRGIYHLMVQCWNPKRAQRPKFSVIFDRLTSSPDSLLVWSLEDLDVSERVSELGAPLEEARELYRDLRNLYYNPDHEE